MFSEPIVIEWEEGAPAPVGCYRHTAVWLDGLVYVGGGYESSSKSSYTINCYDSVSDSWGSPINIRYCFFAMTALSNKLHIAGGRDKSNKKTNQILTMDTGQLKNYTEMPAARSFPTAAGYKKMLIITGGYDDKDKVMSSTELFDSRNEQWYTCSDLPQPHSTLKSVIVNDVLYLLGGINKDNNPSPAVFTAPLVTLSRHKLKWSRSTLQDTPWCCFASMCVHDAHLLTVGGRKMGAECTSSVYKLNKINHNWEAIGYLPSARSN